MSSEFQEQADSPTSGRLPRQAFEHLDPTAVAVLDLGDSMSLLSPSGDALAPGHRDGLILVRLHNDPLKVIYVDQDPAQMAPEALAAEVIRSAGPDIARHLEEHECLTPGAAAKWEEFPFAFGPRCPAGSPTDPALSVAVIICTAGRDEQLARCLRSLLAQQACDFEVVVVDNDPADPRARQAVAPIAAADSRVRYVQEPRRGLSVARNRGVSETVADVVAFTDDDVVVDRRWLSWLIAPFAAEEVAASCGLVLPFELETEAQKHFERYAGFSKGLQRRSYGRDSGPAPGLLLYPFINGALGVGNNMAFRKEALLRAGGFDPALGAGAPAGSCEETCAFGRVLLSGARIAYEPRALCWHEHRRTSAGLERQVYGYGTGLGAVLAKAALSDLRFYGSVAKSLRVVLAGRRGPNGGYRPPELFRERRRGVIRGPALYAIGLARSRRHGLRAPAPTAPGRSTSGRT